MMNNQIIFKKITRLNFRQVIYVIIGLALLVNGIVGKDFRRQQGRAGTQAKMHALA